MKSKNELTYARPLEVNAHLPTDFPCVTKLQSYDLCSFMRQEKPGQESVADAEKLRYPSLPPANVQTLRIGEADPDLILQMRKWSTCP